MGKNGFEKTPPKLENSSMNTSTLKMYAKVGETAWSLFWCALEMTTSKDDWKQHV